MEAIKQSGVKVFWEHSVLDVTLSRTGFVQSVDVRSNVPKKGGDETSSQAAEGDAAQDSEERTESGALRIPCIAVLCCHTALCDRDVFAAVNDCGLVFDGGMVVDAVRYHLICRCVV